MSLAIEGVRYHRGSRVILDDVSFALQPGLTALIGPNGAGKTTLMRLLLGLLKPQSGRVVLDDVSIQTLPRRTIAGRIAYVAQGHVPAFPFSVHEIVAMGRAPVAGWGRRLNDADTAVVHRSLAQVGMQAFADRRYTELSGGERQSVLIARALAQDARILILDEPAASLDFGQQTRLMRVLKGLADDGRTILVSLHQLDLARDWCDDTAILHQGRIVGVGMPSVALTPAMIERLYNVSIVIPATIAASAAGTFV